MKLQPHVYDRVMNRWRCWSLVVCSLVTACGTKANPAFSCSDTPCTDPNFPYCDIDGSVGGIPEACTAVTCTAGAFQSCRGDNIALTCNNSGTSFDEVQCAHGCDPATGCKLCEANQTACENGVVATCDANGVQTSTTNCPLGCFADQPRCRDVDPSNHFGTYFDMVSNPVDLDLTGTWNIILATGTVTNGSTMMTPTSFLAPSLGGGPPTRVFVVNNLKLGNVGVMGPSDGSSISAAFLATGSITVTGIVAVDNGAGAIHSSACVGHPGYASSEPNGATILIPGGGGGAAAMGSSGGDIQDGSSPVAVAGGAVYGTDDLQPLVGGCSAGGFSNQNSGKSYAEGSWGGGAIQLTSRMSIEIDGIVRADGSVGGSDRGQGALESRFGGGGGGGILLEAPVVTLGPHSTVSAAGGDGYGCNPMQSTCGLPGLGGTGAAAAIAGGDVQFMTALGSSAVFAAGTGGGGVGRVRINTPMGTYTLDATATRNALVTTGDLKTR
jgi:hypothetical protein